jgi:wyosine [tRNA(Phe)-imidazoG37] synthetase (radical SAM superfamily)
LGIDLLSTPGKTCSFDCIYCQLGKTTHFLGERKEFVSSAQLAEELETAKGIVADYVTFSGMGEPTLASNLGQAIEIVKSILPLPIAVLTNSSLMPMQDVRADLSQADVVVAKVDAPNEELFHQINRPKIGYTLDEILQAIKLFKEKYEGKLALQMMFVKANKDCAKEMAEVARWLSPDEVQLNTPLRPCPIKPLTPDDMALIKQEFVDLNAVSVYETSKPEVVPLNLKETLRRRIKL